MKIAFVAGFADERALGAGVSAYLRASVTLARETVRIGPFLASFSSDDPLRFLNYAIPEDGAVPTSADVAALTDAYHQRGRLPRLEYVPAAAPAVEAVLVAAGWGVEGRLPLMVLPASTPVDGEPPSGIELVAPASAADLQATVAAQNEHTVRNRLAPTAGRGLAARSSMAVASSSRESRMGERRWAEGSFRSRRTV